MSSLNSIGLPFIELSEVDSTNNYAMGLVREGMAQHGTAVFAHHQTRGKGQRNRQWQSAAGENIALSMVIQPLYLSASRIFLLSMTAALSAFKLLNNHLSGEVKIKWPNDVYWRDRKAAGILIENIWKQGNWNWAITGIGINVNQSGFGELGTRAVSMKQVTGKDYIPAELARELCGIFELYYQLLLKDEAAIMNEYRLNLYKKNEQVKLKKNNRVFEAMILDVTDDGRLVVQHAMEEKFEVGEVEWVG